jgi:hypothetical protein
MIGYLKHLSLSYFVGFSGGSLEVREGLSGISSRTGRILGLYFWIFL